MPYCSARGFMPTKPARALPTALRIAVAGFAWMAPLLAHAEYHDPAEIGHAIWFVGSFSLFFFSTLSLAIWLLVVRLRDRQQSPAAAQRYPNLESVWSRDLPPAPA